MKKFLSIICFVLLLVACKEETEPKLQGAETPQQPQINPQGQPGQPPQAPDKLYSDSILQLKPTTAFAYLNEGNFHFANGRYNDAIEKYNKAIQMRKNFDSAYLNRATTYMRIGKKDQSMKDFDKAIKINPSWGFAYYNRAALKLEIKDTSGVCEDLKKAMENGYSQAEPHIKIFCK